MIKRIAIDWKFNERVRKITEEIIYDKNKRVKVEKIEDADEETAEDRMGEFEDFRVSLKMVEKWGSQEKNAKICFAEGDKEVCSRGKLGVI